MSNDIKIIKQLSKDEFVIKITPNIKPKHITIAHDFIEIHGIDYLHTEQGVSVIKRNITSNGILINSSASIPIRMFSKVVMPLLQNDEYLKEEHLKVRNNGDIPYSYYRGGMSLKFWDKKSKCYKIAYIGEKESDATIMTEEFYKEFVEPKLT